MDPNANLDAQERILTDPAGLDDHDRARLEEVRAAREGWIVRGGFSPDWKRAPLAAKRWAPIVRAELTPAECLALGIDVQCSGEDDGAACILAEGHIDRHRAANGRTWTHDTDPKGGSYAR